MKHQKFTDFVFGFTFMFFVLVIISGTIPIKNIVIMSIASAIFSIIMLLFGKKCKLPSKNN